ncbi:putative prolyl 4-hydroxylase alpha subunit [Cavenderia fasciculata]|uniref:Prolyl 4-hydroxylase alpha subunit n=1 Tax=Cavenderia fasciculata TaxID=261658 RepID=F4PI47_CACFS|nr:putative prolyl 4-hydroxylase alpha subunit [Cavenderia fasciculata]EGG25330.1 putative prolyl 4-hydroxylase alpha subunit [Cavenderia fasciculata]|eukprot:XP_004363181.1 putative prolyl 4-hydroxylase alpha subunit [Cavenderia fasciculata]
MMMTLSNDDNEVVSGEKCETEKLPKLIEMSQCPRVYRVPDFLSPAECEHLIDISKNKLRPCNEISSGVHRSGWGLFMKEGEEDHDVVKKIFQRMKMLVNLTENCEVMQVIRYHPGEETSAHYDYFNPLTTNGAMKIGLYGQRVCTILMYLSEVEEGGETSFPEVGVKVKPVKGDAVLFYNCKPNGEVDPLSLHQGDPVIKGTKWVAIKLINQKNSPPPPATTTPATTSNPTSNTNPTPSGSSAP